jgi:hypothetical protein
VGGNRYERWKGALLLSQGGASRYERWKGALLCSQGGASRYERWKGALLLSQRGASRQVVHAFKINSNKVIFALKIKNELNFLVY